VVTEPVTRGPNHPLTVADNLEVLGSDWRLSLLARGLRPKTLTTYMQSFQQMVDFLRDRGMPLTASAITREDMEAFILAQLEQHKPSTASIRYRAVQQFWRWLWRMARFPTPPWPG
jgi:site-specific recombinase XerD